MRVARLVVKLPALLLAALCVLTIGTGIAQARPTDDESAAPEAMPEKAQGSFPAPVETPADELEARERYDRGLALYSEGEFALAVVEFERAYVLVPDYRTLFNIGQVRLQLGQYAKAHAVLSSYLAGGGSQISPERRVQILADLAMLETRTALLRVDVDVTGAEVSLDQTVLGAAPLPDAVRVDSGEHLVVIRARGYQPKRVRITLASQDAVTVPVRLEPIETVAERVIVERLSTPAPPPADASAWRLGLWVGAGSLAVASAVTTVLGSRAADDLKEKRSELGVSRDELDSGSRRAHTLLLAADVCGALALLAGGGALYLTLAAPEESAPPATTSRPRLPADSAQRGTTLQLGLGWVGVAGSF